MPAKPFNADDYEMECLGFFEEFVDADTLRFVGLRDVEKPDRPIGSPGTQTVTLTETLHLRKPNVKQTPVVVKASKKSPRTMFATLQMKSGKLKNQTWKHEQKNIA